MNTIATDLEDSTSRMQAVVRAQQQRPGYALESYFYRSPVAYRHELERIVYRSWLYAGHVSQVPNPGDFFQYEVGEDAFIISRAADGQIHALVNSCRHRGARVCEEHSGNRKSFVCPYHGWTYGSDGSLRGARHMDRLTGFKKSEHGLRTLRVVVRHGLIFINADPKAFDLHRSIDLVEPALAPYGLEDARIAHQQTYTVEANWKLVLENYTECYHCASSHRNYAKMHTIKDLRTNVSHLRESMLARCDTDTGVCGVGHGTEHIYAGAPGFGACAYTSRYALYDGFLTGSREGRPVAPLMGRFTGYDGGAGDFQIGPLCFMLNYPDHCVLYRFTPRGQSRTDMEIVWFVNGSAVEGRDYSREELTWLWHTTTLEDEYIILRNSAGVNSHFYTPGPFHPEFEQIGMKFIAWYLATLGGNPHRNELAERREARK